MRNGGRSMRAIDWRLYEAGYCTHPELATRAGAPLTACQFPALTAMLRHPKHGVILFDTGYSEHFMRATRQFPERLYRLITPVHLRPGDALSAQLERDHVNLDSVTWIVLSHLHGDHIGGLADFSKSSIALSRAAWEDMEGRSRLNALSKGLLPSLFDATARTSLHWFEDLPAIPLPAPFSAFGTGYDLFGDSSILAVELPGHAAGHYGLLFEDSEGPVFLVADASWSSQAIRERILPPELVTDWLGDTGIYHSTLEKLNMLWRQAPHVRIVPSHCREWRPNRGGPSA